jgi:hypothetical protein
MDVMNSLSIQRIVVRMYFILIGVQLRVVIHLIRQVVQKDFQDKLYYNKFIFYSVYLMIITMVVDLKIVMI